MPPIPLPLPLPTPSSLPEPLGYTTEDCHWLESGQEPEEGQWLDHIEKLENQPLECPSPEDPSPALLCDPLFLEPPDERLVPLDSIELVRPPPDDPEVVEPDEPHPDELETPDELPVDEPDHPDELPVDVPLDPLVELKPEEPENDPLA